MRTKLLFVSFGIVFLFFAAPWLRADQVEMQNGDRYSGKVLSLSADTVTLESEVLGKITVPRKKVASLAFGTNATADVAPVSVPVNPPATSAPAAQAGTNTDLSNALRNLGANTNFIGQIRGQMLAGNADAASNYDKMIGDLMSGKLNLEDLRRQAKSSADQLRDLKRDLGPDAGDSFDAYLDVLDNFLKETAAEPTNATPAPQSETQIH